MIYLTYAYEPEIEGLAELMSGSEIHCEFVRARNGNAGEALTSALLSRPAGTIDTLVLNAGFAGALNPSLDVNDIVLVEQFVSENDEPAGRPSLRQVLDIEAWCKEGRYAKATCLTVDEPLRDRAECLRLRARTGADIVDMEGLYLSEVADRHGVAFASTKVISDFADGAANATAIGQAGRWSMTLVAAVYSFIVRFDLTTSGGVKRERWK